ncbi:monocarboxylate transporter 7-like [Amphiura filiformis]|uniref:monocarboxylate transporter 7-like n=1 Tax=Amphiura filiformis TaxID=82378 RepID=UPI003B21BA43
MAEKDGPWSWVVLCGVTFMFFLENGTMKAFSVLLPDLQEQLSSQTWIIGSCISIMTGWGCLLGMFASYLKSRFGVRLCIMFCGLVSSTGLIVCAYATNVYLLLLGIILTGFMYLQENIALGIVPEYFDKYYNLAVNIYGFGSGLAVVVYPLLVQMAQDHYGWHGALLLLGALTTHSLIFGALIKHNKAEKSLSIPLIRDNPQREIDKTNFILNLKFLTSILKRCDANLLTDPSFIFRVVLPGIANLVTRFQDG